MSEELLYSADLVGKHEGSTTFNEDTGYRVEGKTFGIRAVAYIIDSVIFYVTYFGISLVVGMVIGIAFVFIGREPVFDTESSQCLDNIISVLMLLGYFMMFEGFYGASPGKLITGMRVVKEDGQPCNIVTALHRGLWRFIDAILFGAIAYSNMKPPLNQRLGDKKAQTIVVSKDEQIIQQARDWPWFILALVAYLFIETVAILILAVSMIQNL